MDPITAICRDCLREYDARPGPCVTCGSDRILHHPELGRLEIAHIDCDAFYASVEKRDNPELVNKPVLVGGGTRGVVTTACYIARRYGPDPPCPCTRLWRFAPRPW